MPGDLSILTVVGARPQFVKAAVLSQEIAARPGVVESLCHTGQHYDPDMSDVFFHELGIPEPAHKLAVGSGPHGAQTGAMLGGIERVLLDTRPDWVVLYGDTNSTLAGALAAAKLGIRIAHVEAGLRSYNRAAPEEINRVLTDHLSTLLFAPTQSAVDCLRKEGLDGSKVQLVGDIMYDAARVFATKLDNAILKTLELQEKSYAIATIHRPANTDDPDTLGRIIEALASWNDDCPVVMPLHPRTRSKLESYGMMKMASAKLRMIDPVGYLDMMTLLKHATLAITDSGGLQKEAFFHRVPCVTLRTDTEWTELLDLGWNRLCPPESRDEILEACAQMRGFVGQAGEPYGDQFAAKRMLDAMLTWPRPAC